jgi:hypothetical protein
MRNADLQAILGTASIKPELLPSLIAIYKIGHSQGIIDQMKKQLAQLENDRYGINYGTEVQGAN